MEDLVVRTVSPPPIDIDGSRHFSYTNNDNVVEKDDIGEFRARFDKMAHDRISHDVGIMTDEIYLWDQSSATFDNTSVVCPSELLIYQDNKHQKQMEASANDVIRGTETEKTLRPTKLSPTRATMSSRQPKSHQCTLCDKIFSRDRGLTSHYLTCHKEEAHRMGLEVIKCKNKGCGRTYTRVCNFQKHLRQKHIYR